MKVNDTFVAISKSKLVIVNEYKTIILYKIIHSSHSVEYSKSVQSIMLILSSYLRIVCNI